MLAISLPVSRLTGYAPSVPTPFHRNGDIDHAALARLCTSLIRLNAHALVVCGTEGEAATLTRAEHIDVIRIAHSVARGRIPVIAGIGSNSTSAAIDLAHDAEIAGADALLAVVPYYNKPTQAGMLAHFQTIADATTLPVILHDVPSRCACGLADDTVVRLAEHKRIVGLVDSSGDIARVSRLRLRLGALFRLISGDDATAAAYITSGGNGCMSEIANVALGLCHDMYIACRHGQAGRAQRLNAVIAKLNAVLSKDGHPAPLKYALHLLGVMLPVMRLPLVEPTEQTKVEIATAIAELSDCYGDEIVGRARAVVPDGIRMAVGG